MERGTHGENSDTSETVRACRGSRRRDAISTVHPCTAPHARRGCGDVSLAPFPAARPARLTRRRRLRFEPRIG
ncbi:hypothetical protein C5O80_22540 [Burkholderia sp. SRS-46]|nr:hypothetical protein C5O80_22540 [Burkholderia sp. SRS-46]